MTFQELSEPLKDQLEKMAFDAGCSWIEEFREDRGRDPEPEECAEEGRAIVEGLVQGRIRRLIEAHGVPTVPALYVDVQDALTTAFVEALDV